MGIASGGDDIAGRIDQHSAAKTACTTAAAKGDAEADRRAAGDRQIGRTRPAAIAAAAADRLGQDAE